MPVNLTLEVVHKLGVGHSFTKLNKKEHYYEY
jgi:hypothetical protein